MVNKNYCVWAEDGQGKKCSRLYLCKKDGLLQKIIVFYLRFRFMFGAGCVMGAEIRVLEDA